MRPWWERYPARWQAEQAALAAAGASWERVVAGENGSRGTCPVQSGAGAGQLALKLRWPAPVGTFCVLFPDTYPHFPPYVRDDDGVVPVSEHRLPDGTLCLVHDEDWTPTTLLADLLRSHLSALSGTLDSQAATEPEVEHPLPLVDAAGLQTDGVGRVIVDSRWHLDPTCAVAFLRSASPRGPGRSAAPS